MDTAQEIRVKIPNRPQGTSPRELPQDAHPHEERPPDHEQGRQHQGAPGQLGSIESSRRRHSLQQFQGGPLVLQLAVSAGNGGHADGHDDGVHHSQIVKQQHPALAEILGVLAEEGGDDHSSSAANTAAHTSRIFRRRHLKNSSFSSFTGSPPFPSAPGKCPPNSSAAPLSG